MKQIYNIAGRIIEISSLHFTVHSQCGEYRSEGEPDFSIEIQPADIDFEREKSAQADKAEERAIQFYPDDYLETLAVYRKIAEKMPEYDTVLFHGSAIAVEGQAYLFTAASGTGKSTHARLWRKLLGDRAVMVNDDKPLIHISNSGAIIYGTPWDGKHHLSSNIAVPLKSICILERAEENAIRPVTSKEVLPMLIQQTYRPADSMSLAKSLTLIERLGRDVKLYRLGCNMDISAASLSYEMMKEG